MTRWNESLTLFLKGRRYPMNWEDGGIWTVTVDKCTKEDLQEYGYAVMYNGLVSRVEWSNHCSKPARVIEDKWIDCPIPGCHFNRKHQAEMFDQPGFKGAGTVVPVFALRSEDDFGIGEFKDLKPVVDWAASTGQCIIQLLPVNDTTRRGEWKDSYPYSPVSAFALHPIYMDLKALGIWPGVKYTKLQQELNNLPEIDWPRVFSAKMGYIRKAFARRGERDMRGPSYKRFVKENEFWLEEYAIFCAERDGFEPSYYYWMQYHLDKQFSAVVKYARSKGISFKGDLPIGISADSADAHCHPELFNLDSTAGAPPDYFSRDGQNWGFPTYNWEEMAKDNYAWWKARLRHMARYFDAYRIDHILGFFRIWEIPVGNHTGMDGHFNPALPYSASEIFEMQLPIEGLFHEDPRHHGMYQPLIAPASQNLPQWQQERFGALYNDFFYHRHNDFWARNAEKKLPELLAATGMLACGEDLGMVPSCVPGVMDRQRILSLKMRGIEHEGDWKYLSVCATSSHDMETLRMQFQNDPEPWEVKNVLREFLNSPSMLAIFPIQDWLAIDPAVRRKDRNSERINEPADPNHKWRFRIHIDVNSLKDLSGMNAEIYGMLKDSGRFR